MRVLGVHVVRPTIIITIMIVIRSCGCGWIGGLAVGTIGFTIALT